MPFHLLLPLLASLLFVTGLLLIKRATTNGVSPWTITFLANQWGALLFSSMWFLGGDEIELSQLWKPAIIAALYIWGQVGTFSAITQGDVSVATPVFGAKVLLVAILVTTLTQETLSPMVWIAALCATLGIGLVQWTGDSERKRVWLTIVFALMASTAFSFFDLSVQEWTDGFGTGRLLPMAFWFVGLFSLGFIPWMDLRPLTSKNVRIRVLLGTMLIALQAICIVFTLSWFGDAARVNVVYAFRGIWGVTLAYLVAKRWGGSEADLPRKVIMFRLTGATLLTVSVLLVILF